MLAFQALIILTIKVKEMGYKQVKAIENSSDIYNIFLSLYSCCYNYYFCCCCYYNIKLPRLVLFKLHGLLR